MKLELKYIAPYLPYDLKGICNEVTYLLTLEGGHTREFGAYNGTAGLSMFLEHCKPVLRPLSDLTDPVINLIFSERAENETTIARYKTDNSNEITITATYKMMGDVFTDFVVCKNGIDNVDYWIVEILLKNHFDIFELIPNGLAIDINTLKL